MKILVTPTSLTADTDHPAMDRLRAEADEIVFNPYGRPLTESELIELTQDVDGIIAGLDSYTAEALAAAGDRLRVISRYGAGTDRVDLAAAAAHDITVTATPGANATAVAELAVGLMFALARRIPALDRDVRDGRWTRSRGIELSGRTLGVVGFGAIGRGVGQRARALGMEVVAYDPVVPDDAVRDAHAVPMSLPDLLAASDVVSLHVPLLESTRHLIDDAALARMRPGALLVNTSRGGLIDEDAALRALESGRLRGLAVDAYEVEPPTDLSLTRHPAVISTPHTGAHTDGAVGRMTAGAIDNLLAVLAGRPGAYVVSPR